MTDLAKAYFRWHKSRTDGDLWARDRVEEIFLRDTEEGWLLTLDLMAEAPSADALCYVAATQLEILVRHCGLGFIDRIIAEARHNRRVLYALFHIYVDAKNPVFPKYKNFLERCGIETEDDLQSLIDYLE